MQVKTSILPFSDIIVVQSLQVGYERYHIIGHVMALFLCGFRPAGYREGCGNWPMCSIEIVMILTYDTLQFLARQHVRRAEHWRYGSSTVVNFGICDGTRRV